MCRQISSYAHLSSEMLSLALFGAFEDADTSRKGLRGREEVLEKSNTWPEQVLDTLNSCWRALLESLSNTQANVRRLPLLWSAASWRPYAISHNTEGDMNMTHITHCS